MKSCRLTTRLTSLRTRPSIHGNNIANVFKHLLACDSPQSRSPRVDLLPGCDHHYHNGHDQHRRISRSPPILDDLRREYLELRAREALGRVPERFQQPYRVLALVDQRVRRVRDMQEMGAVQTLLTEPHHEGYATFEHDLRAWRAASLRGWGAGAGAGGEEVSPLTEDMLGPEWWETMGECLRKGLADDVRHWDAMGREARGDGSLVEPGDEVAEHDQSSAAAKMW